MSDLSTLIADDLDVFDGVEAVTLRTRRAGGDTETDVSLANALRLQLRGNEQQFAGIQISSDGVRWLLKDNEVVADVSTTVVREGDLILATSPTEVWKIVGVSKKTRGTVWSCLCVKQEA